MSHPYSIVLANGCFDLFHYGHFLHLEQASKLAARLIVSITDDAHVNKGPGRPIYPAEQRAALVEALRCVSGVIIVSGLIEAMEIIRPDILVKGIDYSGGLDPEHEEYCRQHGIQVRYTDTPKLSATSLIRAQRHQGL